MKQFSAILNVILLIAVAVLYYFHFKEHKSSDTASTANDNATVVYINADSLSLNYELYKQKRVELEGQQARIKQDLQEEGGKLQSQIEDYKKKSAIMSKVERDATEKKLGEIQQQLMQKRDEMAGALEDKKDKINEEVFNHLQAYIKDYVKRKGKNYNYILSYQKGGTVIYGKENLDVTKEILEGLNDEFKKDNPLGK